MNDQMSDVPASREALAYKNSFHKQAYVLTGLPVKEQKVAFFLNYIRQPQSYLGCFKALSILVITSDH